MKGVFNLRPALPKNDITWDTTIVLNYLKSLSPVSKLDLKFLTFKLIMLTALLSGQRGQTLHAMTLENTTVTSNHVKFRIGKLLKHSRPGKHLSEISIKGYAPDRRICIVKVLTEYLNRTASIRKSGQLFISHVKPFGPVSKDTIARWVKTVLTLR